MRHDPRGAAARFACFCTNGTIVAVATLMYSRTSLWDNLGILIQAAPELRNFRIIYQKVDAQNLREPTLL